eukprot:m.37335 g.37335  ORF g.37335 m.37335 type:complete len:54 (+) comp14545_c0_seq1:134-295(+)
MSQNIPTENSSTKVILKPRTSMYHSTLRKSIMTVPNVTEEKKKKIDVSDGTRK